MSQWGVMMVLMVLNACDCREQIPVSGWAGDRPQAVFIGADSLPTPLASCVY